MGIRGPLNTPNVHVFPLPEVQELHLVGSQRTSSEPEFLLPAHRHRYMEISYMQRGTHRWWAEREWHQVLTGDVFVTWPGEAHGGGPRSLNSSCLYWVQIPLNERRSPFLGLPRPEGQTLLHELRRLPSRCFRAESNLTVVFERILDAIEGPRTSLTSIDVRTALAELLLTIVRSSQASGPARRASVAHAARELMEQRLDSTCSLSDLAAELGCGLSTLKKTFRREIGISPAQYLLHRRVMEAGRRLEETDVPVGNIAADLGFSSSQYFANVFKRLTGLNPTEFRDAREPWRSEAPLLVERRGDPLFAAPQGPERS